MGNRNPVGLGLAILGVLGFWSLVYSLGQGPMGQDAFVEPAPVGGIQVYSKLDFDVSSVFRGEGSGGASLEAEPGSTAGDRSLQIRRVRPGGYIAARTDQVRVRGTRGLKIAFIARGVGMETVTLNLFDEVRNDNTTPASPARLADDGWRSVVFAVEDFHHNSDPPVRKVPVDTRHTSLMFHGRERQGTAGEFWIDKLVVYRGHDTQPPGAPTDVAAAVEGGAVDLSWKEPSDNAFAVIYSIHRRGAGDRWLKVAESFRPRYRDMVPSPGPYTYRITAADYDNNVSPPSSNVSVTTSSGLSAPSVVDKRIADREIYGENVRRIHASGRGRVRHDVFLFAGDSITGTTSYTHALASWLGRGIAVGQGVGRVTTDYAKARIEEYLAQIRPEFGVVMYGTNDAKDRPSIERAMQNLSSVIDACAQAGTVPIVATIPPRGTSKQAQDDQARFSRAVADLARAKKVPVSYVFEEMMQRDLSQMLYDGVHLTPGPGNDAAGEALWRTFQQVIFALRDPSGAWK